MNHLRATLKTTLTLCLTMVHLVSCGPVPTPTIAGASHSTSPQPTVSVSTSPSTIPLQSSSSQSTDNSLASSTGVWVQVYFPTSQTTDFQIHSLGSSVTITAIDRLGRKQSKSLPTSQAVHTVLFDQLTQGSLTLTFQNPDGSLLGTKESINLGSNQGVIVDFSTQTTPQIIPYVFATLQGRVSVPTEISLGSYRAVEDLHEIRSAATTLPDALPLTLDTPRSNTLYFGSQVNFKVHAKPGRRYKAYLKVTGGSLPATINYSELVIHDTGNNCTGEFITCTRYDIRVQQEQDVFFSVVQQTGPFRDYTPKKGDYASFTVNVLDVGSSQPETNQELPPSLEAILLNRRYPIDGFSRLNAKEKRYISFPAQAGKTYTIHLRTNSGDADLWGGRESFFRSKGIKEETRSSGIFDTVSGVSLKSNLDPTLSANQYPNQGQFIQKDANGQPDLYYDRVQFKAPTTERYVFMINAYRASEYAFRVEESASREGNIPPLSIQVHESFKTYFNENASRLGQPLSTATLANGTIVQKFAKATLIGRTSTSIPFASPPIYEALPAQSFSSLGQKKAIYYIDPQPNRSYFIYIHEPVGRSTVINAFKESQIPNLLLGIYEEYPIKGTPVNKGYVLPLYSGSERLYFEIDSTLNSPQGFDLNVSSLYDTGIVLEEIDDLLEVNPPNFFQVAGNNIDYGQDQYFIQMGLNASSGFGVQQAGTLLGAPLVADALLTAIGQAGIVGASVVATPLVIGGTLLFTIVRPAEPGYYIDDRTLPVVANQAVSNAAIVRVKGQSTFRKRLGCPKGTEAHHIIPKLAKLIEGLEELRTTLRGCAKDLLLDATIDAIQDIINGICLTPEHHHGLHTKDYYIKIQERLNMAYKAEGCIGFAKELTRIKIDLGTRVIK